MKKKKNKKDGPTGYWTYPEAHKALEIGLYYGFTPCSSTAVEKADRDFAKGLLDNPADQHLIYPEEKIALLRAHFLNKNPSFLPFMFICEQKHKDIEKKKDKTEYSLDILGTNKSIADATMIKVCYETALQEGYEDIVVEVNSMGDKDSMGRFTRELTAYFRKHLNELHSECRQMFKKGALAIITCNHEACVTIKQNAPRAMNYLSEPSRAHFKELLELLEMSDIPFTINTTLLENDGYAAHTVFRITGREADKKDPQLIAYGARWANLAKKLGLKKDVPSISAMLLGKKVEKSAAKVKKIPKPNLYFIQMGREAKLKSLGLIEILRRAKIAMHHSLTKDKLTTQLMSAEFLKVPFVLIMGQKESMENTVLIREMNNRSQETVRITEAAEFLKKHLK